MPGEIARVGDAPILKTEYEHWRAVTASSLGLAEDDELVRTRTMELLIGLRWIDAERARLGVVVKPGAVVTTYRRLKAETFPREQDFQQFLSSSRQTVADVKARVRSDLVAERLTQRAVRGAKTSEGQRRQLDRYVKKFNARWKAKTVCGQGFETDDCGSVVPLST